MNNTAKLVEVYGNWTWLGKQALRIGVLQIDMLRGKEVWSFEYDKTWLQKYAHLSLDPDWLAFPGKQFSRDNKLSFGVFADSAPDRWGRMLMQRRESLDAKLEARQVRRLSESDYLLGVSDFLRIGGVRLKYPGKNAFESADSNLVVPPLEKLKTLEQASWELQADEWPNDHEQRLWLDLLLSPGSSIGGARPKASVIDSNNQLWIAKFPGRNDEYDMARFEALVMQLGRQAGLNMAETRLVKLHNTKATLLSKRFDRLANGQRLHFASAMTLLGYTDGYDATQGASYLEIASFITQYGAQPKSDLLELWKRIVFSIYVSNTDDHLRNHGFILQKNGWVLSPAYDIKPSPYPGGLKLNINESENELDLNLAIEVADYFNLSQAEAELLANDIKSKVANWRTIAQQLAVSKRDMELMSVAFDNVL